MNQHRTIGQHDVTIHCGPIDLEGTLTVPDGAEALVIFAHGSGSSRFSPRNQYVADVLHDAGLATLLFDLLTSREEQIDERTAELRFNIELLSERLVGTVKWANDHEETSGLPIGLFGASTGAAAALIAAARLPEIVGAVVSRGGRPDLADGLLPYVKAPTLLIVGGFDVPVIGMNEDAARQLRCEHRVEIVPAASHLFEEPGKLDEAAHLACDWFHQHLTGYLPMR